MAFDPTGRYLATVTSEGGALVFDLVEVARGTPPGEAVVFSRIVDTGQMISVDLDAAGRLATDAFGSLRMWDAHTGELIVDVPVEGDGPP